MPTTRPPDGRAAADAPVTGAAGSLTPTPAIRPLWRSSSYWAWLVADTGQALGTAMQLFLIPLLVVLITGNAAAAGTVAALGMGARVATTLLGGVLADRHDLRRMMILGGALAALLIVGMAIVLHLHLGLVALGSLNALAGIRAGLLGSSSNAALKQVVPSAQLPGAAAANQARDAAVQLGGAPLGGVLVGIAPFVALAATATSYLAATLGALVMRGDFRADRGPARSTVRADVAEGMRWLWSQPVLRRVLLVALLLNLGLNAASSTVLYHLAMVGESPARIGLVSTAVGAGMLVGAALAGPMVQRLPSGPVVIGGVSLAGLSVLALPFVPGFWPVLAVFAIGMLGAPMTNAAILSYFMHRTPRAVLGRAMSAVELLSTGLMPLGPILAGWGLATIGLRSTLIIAAVLCLLAVCALVTSRALRSLPRPSEWE